MNITPMNHSRCRYRAICLTASLLMIAGLALPSAQAQLWLEQGPAPMINGQVEGMSSQSNPVNGAIERIAVSPTDANTMLIGAVNGGIWRTTNATAANPSWTPVSDFLPSLSMGSLSFDAANSSTLYAGVGRYSALAMTGGARAGLFKSTDGGATWGAVAGNSTLASYGLNINATVANGQTILLTADNVDSGGYNTRGLWRSTNGGASFSHVTAGLPSMYGAAVVADPTNANRYYLAGYNPSTAANNGVWRSNDGGASWTKINNAAINAVANTSTGNVKLSVNNNGTLFVGIVDNGELAGVFRTTDQGATFTDYSIPYTVDGPTGNTVTNGIHPGGQGGIHFSLVADPANDNVVYVGGDRQPLGSEVNGVSAVGASNYSGRLFRSSSPGSWTAITNNQTSNGSSPHADSRCLTFDRNGNLIESDDGGLYRRTSPGNSSGAWSSLGGSGVPGGLRTAEIHSVAYDNHGGVIIAGTQDTGSVMQSTHNGTTWNTLMQGDGGVVAVYDRPGGNSYRYYNYVNLYYFSYRAYNASGSPVGGTVSPALTVNGSGGQTIQQFEPTAFPSDEGSKATVYGPDAEPGVPFYAKYVANKVDAGRLVFGTNALYETADHGATLNCLGGVTGSGPAVKFSSAVNALAYGGFKGTTGYADVLYSGAGTQLRIRPAGGGFNVLPTVNSAYNAAAGSSGFAITDVVEDYTDWDMAFVADSSERVFRTSNAGSSWAQMPGGLASLIGNDLETLEYVEHGSSRAVFAGGLNGVFISLDPGNGVFGAWSEFGAGSLPNAKVRDLDYDPYADVLVVGLQGRGAWSISNASLYVVPEPSTFAMLCGSIVAISLWFVRRRPK
jgi:hypothetical protein